MKKAILLFGILLMVIALGDLARSDITPPDNWELRLHYNITGVNFLNASVINASDWSNVSITESQVSDLVHTTDTNASTECSGEQVLLGNTSCKDSSMFLVNTSATMTGNLTLEEVHLEADSTNHRIYDNATCVIIKGDTATLEVC